MDYNAAGQHHADWYVKPRDEWTVLRCLDGGWSGHLLHVSQLRYDDAEKARARAHGFPEIDGFLRLDYHERLKMTPESGVASSAVLHRGGWGYEDFTGVKYGHVLLADVDDSRYELGAPKAAGEGRGVPAADAPGLYAVRCRDMPGMLYKDTLPDGSVPWGSMWQTYSDQGDAWGGDVHYKPLLWSFLNVAGGGMVRGELREGQRVRRCAISRLNMPIWNAEGQEIGEVVGQYVRTGSKAYGWMLWAHRSGTARWTYHAERIA